MNHWRSVLGIVTGSAKKPPLTSDNKDSPFASEPKDKRSNETKLASSSSPSLEATETTTHHHHKAHTDAAPNENDDESLSSLSFYEDFPTLYFAIRKGKYIHNAVLLSWDSARKHIVDYPQAEYIATPTLEQAHRYINSFGEFKQGTTDTVEPSTNQKAKQDITSKPKPSTRSLLLEYYETYDPGWKAKGQKRLKIAKFLKRKKMYQTKSKIFIKHWQRSGLMMMRNDEKPLEEAIAKYDRWIAERKLEQREENEDGKQTSRKRKRQTTNDSERTAEKRIPVSTDSNDKKPIPESTDSNNKKPIPVSTNSNNKQVETVPTKTKKQKSLPKTSTHTEIDGTMNIKTIDNSCRAFDKHEHKWMENYEKLKAFHVKHGHCKVKKVQGAKLQAFCQYTRRRMYREVGRPLSLQEENLLNDLDFEPLFKQVSTKFRKFRGKRIMKHFDIEVETANGKPVLRKKQFFGTVGCISDVYRQYLHITYDDGDSEDFDMKWLKEGIANYTKNKHRDPLRISSKKIASTKQKATGSKNVVVTRKRPDKSATATASAKKTNAVSAPVTAKATKFNNMVRNTINEDKMVLLLKKKAKEMETKANGTIGNYLQVETKANTLEAQDNRREAKVTPESNQNGTTENARRVSDLSNSNLNDSGKKPPRNDCADDNGNESDSSDEVEIVEVRVPHRPNPNLFDFPDLVASTASNTHINTNNINNSSGYNFGGINPYSAYREGFYDF